VERWLQNSAVGRGGGMISALAYSDNRDIVLRPMNFVVKRIAVYSGYC